MKRAATVVDAEGQVDAYKRLAANVLHQAVREIPRQDVAAYFRSDDARIWWRWLDVDRSWIARRVRFFDRSSAANAKKRENDGQHDTASTPTSADPPCQEVLPRNFNGAGKKPPLLNEL